MKLCYSCNRAYLPGLLMTVMSAAMVTSEKLEVILLTGDFSEINPAYTSLTEEDALFLESVIRLYNPENRVTLIDMTEGYKAELQTYKTYEGHFSPYTLLRLFINDFYDSGRILYIDIDTIVMKDLTELYHMDMQGNMIAMAVDVVGVHWIAADYCNAGVILFDMDAAKGTDRFEKCRTKVKENSMIMPDQSAINKYFRDTKFIMHGKYNEQHVMRDETVIRHYCRVLKFFPWPHYVNAKPWDDLDFFHKDRKEYQCDHIIQLAREYLKLREEGKEITLLPTPEISENTK